jgi:hypothetical protein
MKKILWLFLFLSSNSLKATNFEQLRECYFLADKSKVDFDRFVALVKKEKDNDNPVLQCYKGIAIMMKSNYIFNPISKLKNFNKGKIIVEKLVVDNNRNLEIRFLRFCAQTHCPQIVGYNNNIKEDKIFILQNLDIEKDQDLKNKIKLYLSQSK